VFPIGVVVNILVSQFKASQFILFSLIKNWDKQIFVLYRLYFVSPRGVKIVVILGFSLKGLFFLSKLPNGIHAIFWITRM
jgi:hypothetical protein